MKSIYVLIVVSLLFLLFSVWLTVMVVGHVNDLTAYCRELQDAVSQEDMVRSQELVAEIASQINRYNSTWLLLSNHNELDAIQEKLTCVQVALAQEDWPTLTLESRLLEQAIQIIAEKEIPRLHNII